MKRRFGYSPARVDEENPYWLSFSDLMSALLVIFLLAAVALIIELSQTQKIIQQDIQALRNGDQARKDILYEVRDALKSKDILVEVTDNDTVLRIPQGTLSFLSNRDEIPEDSEAAVIAIGEALHSAINKPFSQETNLMRFEYLDTVFIEGHTDSLHSPRVKGNWGLSAFRAISLWEYWENNLQRKPSFESMKNAFGEKLFSVSGYAASRRVQTDERRPEQREKNRRIDLRFTVKRPSIVELEKIADQ
ncbi:MAG: OmpA family protein [Kistimonas sp.]|nr:OmpA family protein [Kistimonas sp.]